jgi:cytochrome c oxidase subunit IV
MAHSHTSEAGVIAKPNTKAIWKTFWILLGVTALEFLIAFTSENKLFRISTFLLLTVVKAFFIVAEFMHLKHEVKALIYSVLIPIAFIVWLVIALIVEGGSILESH